MIVTYYGHACFKLRGKQGTVITDPYSDYVGFDFPSLSADIVTVSHDHPDHNNHQAVSGTARRNNPFIIDHPGEYEVEGVSVFAVKTFHDEEQGSVQGENVVYTVLMDGLRLCHLGALGHELDEQTVSEIGMVDVLFVPVGGNLTIGPKQAVQVARALEPNLVVPMHYRTEEHNQNVFGDLAPVEEFIKAAETEPETEPKLNLTRSKLPEEMEIVILDKS
jgi:L-ascorbate metabolism protein UlaG (beta-lactamase superfamily)